MSNEPLGPSALRFIDDVARLFASRGVPQAAARLCGYLLLSGEPVSLDRIAVDLEISKSSASVAARLLEKYGLARRLGERGTKRALYEIADTYEEMMAEQNQLLRALEDLLLAGTDVAASPAARRRMTDMAAFYATIRQAMESTIREWRARRTETKIATSAKRRA